MTVAVHPDILSCLQYMRQDVERRIATLDRFRAVKAIEQTIADFPGLDDLARSLSDIRDQVRAQLDETREFRALRSLERIIPELSEVLVLMDDAPAVENWPTASAPPEPAGSFASGVLDETAASEAGMDVEALEIVASGAPADTVTPTPVFAESAGDASVARTEEGLETHPVSSRPEAISPGPAAEPVPSLADSVAQLMAQSILPQREGNAPPSPHPHERGDAPLTQAERAA